MTNRLFYYLAIGLLLFIFLAGIAMQLKWHYALKLHNEHFKRVEQYGLLFGNLSEIEFGFFYEKDTHYLAMLEGIRNSYAALSNIPCGTRTMGIWNEYSPVQRETMKRHKDLVAQYLIVLGRIFEEQQLLGLDHNQGLYGALRIHAHNFEKMVEKLGDDHLMLKMLIMRRHEKDFMLRALEEYITKYKSEYLKTADLLKLPQYADQEQLRFALTSYAERFFEFVEHYNTIGYGTQTGLTAESRKLRDEYKNVHAVAIERYDLAIDPLEKHLSIVVVVNFISFTFLFLLVMLLRKEIANAEERNPLTGLNGNRRIEEHLRTILRFRSYRAVIYFDFDNFKPFNDRFGFKVGDEVILQFAQLLKEVFGQKGHFLGHIGGDDFIVIEARNDFEKTLKKVAKVQRLFAEFAMRYYSSEEVAKGGVLLKDRYGVERHTPLLQVSASIIQLHPNLHLEQIKQISSAVSLIKGHSKLYGLSALSIWSSEITKDEIME